MYSFYENLQVALINLAEKHKILPPAVELFIDEYNQVGSKVKHGMSFKERREFFNTYCNVITRFKKIRKNKLKESEADFLEALLSVYPYRGYDFITDTYYNNNFQKSEELVRELYSKPENAEKFDSSQLVSFCNDVIANQGKTLLSWDEATYKKTGVNDVNRRY